MQDYVKIRRTPHLRHPDSGTAQPLPHLTPRIATTPAEGNALGSPVVMVTGVETAGLVLAVLPLLIEALSVYKKGLEKTGVVLGFKQKRYKLKVERLRLQLKGQSASLHLNLAKLVSRAAPNEDFVKLPEDYNDALWTGETAEKIKAYLQPGGAFEAFEGTLSLYESYLEEIAEKLVGILRPSRVCRRVALLPCSSVAKTS